MAKTRGPRPPAAQAPAAPIAAADVPAAPTRAEPTAWEHYELWKRVCDAIRSLPDHFKTTTNIEGMLATDIFTLNSALGATIEEQVVHSLNSLRPVWDPNKEYQTFAF